MRDDLLDDSDAGGSESAALPKHAKKQKKEVAVVEEVELPSPGNRITHDHDIKVQLPHEQMFVRPDQLGTGISHFQPVSMQSEAHVFSSVALPSSGFQPVPWENFWLRSRGRHAKAKAPDSESVVLTFLFALIRALFKPFMGKSTPHYHRRTNVELTRSRKKLLGK